MTISTSPLSENYNISMMEIGSEAGSLVGLNCSVSDIKIHEDNLLYMFEEVTIGTINGQ
jgi:hypothetical protein